MVFLHYRSYCKVLICYSYFFSSKSRLLNTCKGGRSWGWTQARQASILTDQGTVPQYPRMKIEQVWWWESEPTEALSLPEKPLATNPGKSDKSKSQVTGPGLGSAKIMAGHRTTSSKDLRLNVAAEIKDGWKIMTMQLPALPHTLPLSPPTAPRLQGHHSWPWAQQPSPWEQGWGRGRRARGCSAGIDVFFQLDKGYSFRNSIKKWKYASDGNELDYFLISCLKGYWKGIPSFWCSSRSFFQILAKPISQGDACFSSSIC